jgi:hypothetical protein
MLYGMISRVCRSNGAVALSGAPRMSELPSSRQHQRAFINLSHWCGNEFAPTHSFGCWRHITVVGGSDVTSYELPRTAERTEIEPKIVWTEPRPLTTSIELNHEWDRTGSHKVASRHESKIEKSKNQRLWVWLWFRILTFFDRVASSIF